MNWAINFWRSSVGKKTVMAITGIVGLGFSLGHMLGNMQVYLGPDALNGYAVALHNNAPLLWGTRVVILLAVVGHIIAAVQLQGLKRKARPVRYQKPGIIQATPASRTMIFSGLLILWFLLYHLAHFTWGNAHPQFIDLNPHHNIVVGFNHVPSAVFYIVAMVALGMHLSHGAFSLFFSLGLVHPKYKQGVRMATYALMMAVVAGNISIPVAVLAGVIK